MISAGNRACQQRHDAEVHDDLQGYAAQRFLPVHGRQIRLGQGPLQWGRGAVLQLLPEPSDYEERGEEQAELWQGPDPGNVILRHWFICDLVQVLFKRCGGGPNRDCGEIVVKWNPESRCSLHTGFEDALYDPVVSDQNKSLLHSVDRSISSDDLSFMKMESLNVEFANK